MYITRHENNGWQLVVFNYLICLPKKEMELLGSISHSAKKSPVSVFSSSPTSTFIMNKTNMIVNGEGFWLH